MRKRKRRSDARMDLALATSMYEDGYGCEEIADICGVNSATVYRALKREGVTMRSRGEAQRLMIEQGRKRVLRGQEHWHWRGGRRKVTSGRHNHWMVLHPRSGRASAYVYEHILVAERILGRRLRPNEVVHHINGDGLDNSPSNLRVMTRREHQTVHAEIRKSFATQGE